jgi:CubicO group peptidase (beta-lactamase class C family)
LTDKPLYLYAGDEVIKSDSRSRKITARMVLSHTTGLPNLGDKTAVEFHFEPGSGFKYSGHAYQYLQRIIEKNTNKSLNILAQEIVFEPLSMNKTSYIWRESYANVVSNSYNSDMVKFEVKQEALSGNAAWSLYTTLGDYSKFVIHIMRSSKMKGSPASQMLAPKVDVAKDVKWGLGWGIQDTIPNRSFWHWGSLAGFRHYVVAYPKEEMAVIVMTNSQNAFKMVDDVMVKSIGGSYPSYDWF